MAASEFEIARSRLSRLRVEPPNEYPVHFDPASHWLVTLGRLDGVTVFHILEHVEPGICLDPEAYWPEGYKPQRDAYGYPQPDQWADISDFKLHKARLISQLPAMMRYIRALEGEVERLWGLSIIPDDEASPSNEEEGA